LDRRPAGASAALALLAGEALVLFALSAAVHRRLIESVESRGRRTKAGAVVALTPALPSLSQATSAVAAAQPRTGLRSVRGRVIVLMPGPLLAIMTLAFRAIPDQAPWAAAAAQRGYLLLSAGALFSLYALQAFSMNLFASDRAGLTQQFLAPVSDLALARGKVTGVGLMLGFAVGLCAISSLVVAPSGPPALWLAALLGLLSAYLLLTPLMVWLSAMFPVASDLSKTGSGGNLHSVAMLAGTLLTALAAAPAPASCWGLNSGSGAPGSVCC
jgi:hypothetical protein